jgi:Flp pilus assembly pilin Flp
MKTEVIKKISSRAITRLESRGFATRRLQHGAAALEYLVLAAAIVLLLGGALSADLGATITDAFVGIFEDAAGGGQ